MNLTSKSINNPAIIAVITCLVFMLGCLSIFKLPNQLLPTIERPQLHVSTNWRAAAPEELESAIIEPQEFVLKSISGLQEISSYIEQGFGSITLTFETGADMDKARLDVINSLNQAPPLPLDADESIISEGRSNNAASLLIRPIDKNNSQSIYEYQKLIEDVVKPRLGKIKGVSQVNLMSHRRTELQVTFDPFKIASLGISLDKVADAVSSNSDMSGGFVNVGRRKYTVRFSGRIDTDSLSDKIILFKGDTPIYLRDIATIDTVLSERRGFSLRNSMPAYYITIDSGNNVNTVELMDGINQAINELNSEALKEVGLQIDLSFDASVHIRNAIALVLSNLGMGVFLALLILNVFLRDIRTTLIIATTIPVSLMFAFIALNVLGRSLNVISLAGLAFSVGLVLDAAIIVQENIVRYRSNGLGKVKSIIEGSKQVSGALFASTITSVAIFLPILFMEGIEGQLFSDLAITLAVAVIASLISAITVLPVASKLWMKVENKADPFSNLWITISNLSDKLTNSLVKRLLWIFGLIGSSICIVFLLTPKADFLPRVPTDGFFMGFDLPSGVNVETIESELAPIIQNRLEPFALGEREPKIKDHNFFSYGPSNTGGFIYLDDPKRVEELMHIVRSEVLADLPGTEVFLSRGSMIRMGRNGAQSIDINIQGPDIELLIAAAKIGMEEINEKLPGAFPRPFPGLQIAEPELNLTPNDYTVSQSGLNRDSLGQIIRALTGGLFIGEYFDGNKRLDIIMRSQEWVEPDRLVEMPVYTPLAGLRTIGELTELTRTVGPTQLSRYEGQRTFTISLSPPTGVSMQEALDIVKNEITPKIQQALPSDSRILISGNADQMKQAISTMAINFSLALFILFLIMSALFKSVTDSLLVLLVLPLAAAGSVIGLEILNIFIFQSLDLLTMIGFIILLGLVVNNAILLVEQTRNAEREGLNRDRAVKEAVKVRARPIFMSTLTSLCGMIPLILVPGIGAEVYRGLATVIFGGMLVSATFTLVLLPSLLKIELARLFNKRGVNIANHS
ncbi:hypothetical protein N474_12105 [Pseudoalteromonas luteoviolacea CPMOR-2]|uniref:efflux RND transporter permease subunit n=1 Tax=Pseudoalteromonas luteoviolacea TaxID=43657 RepID=UPI0007B0A4E6|nr:efflux RND transporter permease subunit [Pseudoalteromonas luteoviolacea]KZN56014.1 hypothetical protein N474_12105 [Pseudoalteromonas luteoviolacea CPMOR-2]